MYYDVGQPLFSENREYVEIPTNQSEWLNDLMEEIPDDFGTILTSGDFPLV